jgi:SsrA-binding protein
VAAKPTGQSGGGGRGKSADARAGNRSKPGGDAAAKAEGKPQPKPKSGKKAAAGAGNAPTVTNRTARFKYHIEETIEAGMQLRGTEVKAIRAGKANLTDSYVRFRGSEAFLVGCHIGAYEGAGQFNHEPMRERKLLLHRRELDKLSGRVREKGLTTVVTKLYFKDGRIKAEVALARGKKAHDKRETIRERAVKKEMERAIKQRMR